MSANGSLGDAAHGPNESTVSDTESGMTNPDIAVLVRSLIATLDDPAFALPDGKQTNILLLPGDVQVESGRLDFAIVLARGERATALEALVRENLLSKDGIS